MNDGWLDKTEPNINEVNFIGKRVTDFKICYISNGEIFYKAIFASERKSGFMDCIPVLVSSGQRNSLLRAGDRYAYIKGQFQSHNQYRQNRRRVMLSIFAQEVHFMTERVHELVGNRIYLKGHVCKDTVYRTTLRGLKITDILVAVNRPTGGSDYLPCISWGKYAIYASDLSACELKVCSTKKPWNPTAPPALPAVPELSALCVIRAPALKGGKNVSENNA